MPIAEAAVYFDSSSEILRAQGAALGSRLERQRAARTDGVTELPRLAGGDVLGDNCVLGNIPAMECFRENQLGFEFVLVFLTGFGVGGGVIFLNIMPFDFFQYLVGAADLLVFNVKHRVDEVLPLKNAEAIFQPEAGEKGALVKRGLAVEVEFSGP